MNLKKHIQSFLFYVLALAILSAAVPLHNIFHQHHYIQTDHCGAGCKKHLKTYTKPCCTATYAQLIGDMPLQELHVKVVQPLSFISCFYLTDNYFQFFHLTRNKAPPALS
ncbi:hypothetical protein BCY91_14355 [Pelobium manganitolerans]|uniref:Uncharacterized protein n=1 Tax=Pelobium manganitolerans TaxID=1842495 RepID=A0A419SAH5_9SPHI|nr:hypothetical protein [Pelobium manganitolerans]RKD19054.1 hypothetical protein BCY91_14355 [Pelobium manganitolerans]